MFISFFPQHRQEVYFLATPPISYLVIEQNAGEWWAMEQWTDSQYRGQGLAAALLTHVVKAQSKRLFVDRQLTMAAARMIERLIASGAVNAAVVDIDAGTITAYDPNDAADQQQPMYDRTVPGITRPLLSAADRMRYTWLLESRNRRSGMLHEYVRYLPGIPLKQN